MPSTTGRSNYLRETRGVRLAAWRAIGSGLNKLVIESFMDEIAHAQGRDPVQLRLLAKPPRGQRVIEKVAEMPFTPERVKQALSAHIGCQTLRDLQV